MVVPIYWLRATEWNNVHGLPDHTAARASGVMQRDKTSNRVSVMHQ